MNHLRIPIFLFGDDETLFARLLQQSADWIRFYDTEIAPPSELLTPSDSNGRTLLIALEQGPRNSWVELGVGIYMVRSRVLPPNDWMRHSRLMAGSLSLDYDEETRHRVSLGLSVFHTALQKLCTDDLVRVSPDTGKRLGRQRGVWAGPNAVEWARTSGLLSRGVNNEYFMPNDKAD